MVPLLPKHVSRLEYLSFSLFPWLCTVSFYFQHFPLIPPCSILPWTKRNSAADRRLYCLWSALALGWSLAGETTHWNYLGVSFPLAFPSLCLFMKKSVSDREGKYQMSVFSVNQLRMHFPASSPPTKTTILNEVPLSLTSVSLPHTLFLMFPSITSVWKRCWSLNQVLST